MEETNQSVAQHRAYGKAATDPRRKKNGHRKGSFSSNKLPLKKGPISSEKR